MELFRVVDGSTALAASRAGNLRTGGKEGVFDVVGVVRLVDRMLELSQLIGSWSEAISSAHMAWTRLRFSIPYTLIAIEEKGLGVDIGIPYALMV